MQMAHGYDKMGKVQTSFVCDSFNEDVIWLKGKAYIGRKACGEGYDSVRRMGYYYGQLGNDNCYFALRRGNKWALKSFDSEVFYLDFIECDDIHEMGWTPIGYYAILKRGEKYQLCIGRKNNAPLLLADLYESISMRYCMKENRYELEGICFGVKKGNKWAICSNDMQYLSPFIFDKIGDMINENEIIGIRLVNNQEVKVKYKIVHPTGWKVKSSRVFSAEEIAAVANADVVAAESGKSVCFHMRTGGQTYIPLSEYSILTVGDTLDLKNAILLSLCRKGNDYIYRVIE